jgi:hypothetical protein
LVTGVFRHARDRRIREILVLLAPDAVRLLEGDGVVRVAVDPLEGPQEIRHAGHAHDALPGVVVHQAHPAQVFADGRRLDAEVFAVGEEEPNGEVVVDVAGGIFFGVAVRRAHVLVVRRLRPASVGIPDVVVSVEVAPVVVVDAARILLGDLALVHVRSDLRHRRGLPRARGITILLQAVPHRDPAVDRGIAGVHVRHPATHRDRLVQGRITRLGQVLFRDDGIGRGIGDGHIFHGKRSGHQIIAVIAGVQACPDEAHVGDVATVHQHRFGVLEVRFARVFHRLDRLPARGVRVLRGRHLDIQGHRMTHVADHGGEVDGADAPIQAGGAQVGALDGAEVVAVAVKSVRLVGVGDLIRDEAAATKPPVGSAVHQAEPVRVGRS